MTGRSKGRAPRPGEARRQALAEARGRLVRLVVLLVAAFILGSGRVVRLSGGLTGAAFVLASAGAGPGVQPHLEVWPQEVAQGGWVRLRLTPWSPELQGELAKEAFKFYRYQGAALALVAVSYHVAPGTYPVQVQTATGATLRREISVRPREFPVEHLRVPPALEQRIRPDDPAAQERLRREQRELEQARMGSSPSPLWDGPFVWPVRPVRVTSEFGLVRVVNGRPAGRHSGLDLAAPSGTPVVAANAGRVALARWYMATGGTILLDHGWGLFTSYLHLEAMEVAEGQPVRPGQLIGRVGATGFATGPHLHWSAWLPGGYVDPRALVDPQLWPPVRAVAEE